MPHFHIEYSNNLESILDIGGLCEAIRAEAAQLVIFPLAGIRVRAWKVDHYAIADGDAKHGFVDISVRLREGRTDDEKKTAIQCVFNTAKTFMLPVMAHHSIALSAEIRDIGAEFSPKFSTIRDHLEEGIQ